ncbi:MAG: hypothetical protein WBP11_05135 [Dokdonella sp.]
MSKRLVVLLCISMLALASLLFGAEHLQYALAGGLPLGNLVAAIGLVAAAWAALGLLPRRGPGRLIGVSALLVALAWLPVSIALAGNLALVFSGWRGDAWMALTAATLALVLCVLAASLLWVGYARWRLSRNARQVRIL